MKQPKSARAHNATPAPKKTTTATLLPKRKKSDLSLSPKVSPNKVSKVKPNKVSDRSKGAIDSKPIIPNTIVQSEKIGQGKDGITYKVSFSTNPGIFYAMKTFKDGHSSKAIDTEAHTQMMASACGAAPRVLCFNAKERFIIMDQMNDHLVEHLKANNGVLSAPHQKRIVDIMRALDESGIFHNDANIMNLMLDHKKKIYLIDYGMSKKITPSLCQKLKTYKPNTDFMLSAICIKMREAGCPQQSYKHMFAAIDPQRSKHFC